MIGRVLLVAAWSLVVGVSPAMTQIAGARTAVLFESYDFGGGVLVDRVSQLTVPVVVNLELTRAVRLTLSGGYTSVSLTSADPGQLADQQISGSLDTEVRLSYDVVPGRLVVLATGAAPTGTKSVATDELAVIGALSTDVIGFSAANVGTGGNVGGGFAGAVPLGRFALGFGGAFRQQLTYQPIAGLPDQLRPGAELRVRAGLEGPLARRTYVRFAGIYAARGKDVVNDSTLHGVGNRVIGYLSVNQGIGARTAVTLYAWDVFRGDPQVEPTATGAAVFPRGNLLALGGRLRVELSQRASVTPRAEYRISVAAPDTGVTALKRVGNSVRFGASVRLAVAPRAAVVFQGSGISGALFQSGRRVDFSGFRAGVNLEYRP